MKILFHNNFKKEYKKLTSREQRKCDERMAVFGENPYSVALKNHPLHGVYKGFRSISIMGDIRAIYELIDDDIAYFITIGTHSDLYS